MRNVLPVVDTLRNDAVMAIVMLPGDGMHVAIRRYACRGLIVRASANMMTCNLAPEEH